MAIVEVKGLSKKYGKLTALSGVDFELNEGEIFGFIGPNGAGKTTTIRILLGILQATKGHATIFGKDVWKDAVEIHKRIAYVPGDVSLWDNLTGGEVIDLFISLQGTHNKKRKEDLLKRFDLDPTKKCGTYSKGNRQKVALVAALASDADLYILDEPTSGLDPLMEKVFQDYVRELKAQGKTIFLSSHILSQVEELCDRISIIRKGKIIETGTMKELRHLTRSHIKAETNELAHGVESMKGVYKFHKHKNTVEFDVDNSELGEVISRLDKYGIKSLICTPPSLEELFITHYKNDGAA